MAEIEKSLWQAARITNVLSPTQFQSARLAEYGDEYFSFWTVYVLRDIRSVPGAVAAPQGEQQIITAFTSAGGLVTHPAFTVPMVAGDEILMIHPNIGAGIGAAIVAVLLNLAALQADVGDASTSILGNIYGILGDPAVDLATSIAAILAGTGTSQGLFYYGTVTGAAAPSFTIAALAGLGNGKFADVTAPYWAFVMRRAAAPGVAPQGEQQAITAYVSAGGVFTAGAFTPPGVAIGDEVLIIHPRLAEIATILTNVNTLIASSARQLFIMDFWSNPQEEVPVAGGAGTLALPDVTIADLPVGATVVRAIALFKARIIENTNVAANKLDGATNPGISQVIQVRDDTPGVWRDAINFVDDQFGIAAGPLRETGDVLLGSIDIAVEVDGNDTYNFQWLLAKADVANINFNDVQVGLRIWYSV